MNFTNKRQLIQISKYALTAVLFYFLFLQVPFTDLLKVLSGINFITIAYFYLISVLLIYISCLKWKAFLGPFRKTISAWKLFELYHLGYFVNLLLPSFVGGDAARSWQIGKIVGQDTAFAATFLERYTGFLAMLLLALCSIQIAEIASFEIKISVIALALIFLFSTVFLLKANLAKISNRLPIIRKFSKKIAAFQSSLHLGFKNCKALAESLILSLLFHSFTVLNTLVAAYMVGWQTVPIVDLFITLPIILVISALPLTPNGLGLQEGAFFVILQSLGASAEQALGIALLLRVKSYVLGLLGGIIYVKEVLLKPAASTN